MKIIAITTHTLDGFIARGNNEFIDWSSKEDKQMFAQETKKAGVVIVGNNTFKTFPNPLKNRLHIVLTRDPQAYQNTSGQVEYTNHSPRQIVAELTDRGFNKAFVIGGAKIYTLFLKEKLLDELWISLEPVIFGQGIPNFTEKFYDYQCSLIDISKLNENTVLLKYKLKQCENSKCKS